MSSSSGPRSLFPEGDADVRHALIGLLRRTAAAVGVAVGDASGLESLRELVGDPRQLDVLRTQMGQALGMPVAPDVPLAILAGVVRPPSAPAAREEPAAGARVRVELAGPTMSKLAAVAGALEVPGSAMALAAAIALLSRYTGRTSFTVLASDGCRGGPRVIRVNLDGEPARDLLIVRAVGACVNGQGGPAEVDAAFTYAAAAPGAVVHLDVSAAVLGAVPPERVPSHALTLLEGLLNSPTTPFTRLPLLAPEEQRLVIGEWNATAGPFPRDLRLHEAFEAQARATPDAVAVTFGNERLTYADLDLRATRLARRLRALGVARHARVGLCMERSIELMVGLWGILKAGAAFVPLDPGAPEARLAAIVADAGCPLVLTQAALVPRLVPSRARTVCLDAESTERVEGPLSLAEQEGAASDIAYVIYTSGSTGTPKGVLVSHRSVLNFRQGILQAYFGGGPRPLQQVALNSPIFFDASVEEWLSLLDGCTLHIPDEETRKDPFAYLRFLRERGIQCFSATPSQLQVLTAAGLLTDPGLRLQTVMAGGEAVSAPLWDALAMVEGAPFYNTYGPTEATVEATFCRITRAEPRPVLGRPLLNVRVYVLDAHRDPVPIGVAGELYIGGPGVAEGYLNRPDLTAERFLPDPFDAEPQARMYRSGDLARWLPDGQLEFLGRADEQVKIRGHRIELGEIEAALARIPDVASAVVLAREDEPGEKRLVAYVLPATRPAPTAVALREALLRILPDYMVPAAFVAVDAWPLTPSGKVDRKALPAPGAARLRLGTEYVPPSTPTEALLCELWGRLLRVDQVGVLDDFFALGGDSLLATQVVSRLRSAIGADLPVRAVYEAPTVAALAGRAEASAGAGRALPPLAVLDSRDGLPLSVGQERLWFEQQWDPASPAYSVPLLLRLKGALDAAAIERALGAIVARHEPLRTRFASLPDGRLVQRVDAPVPVRLERIEFGAAPGAQRESDALVHIERLVGAPFDLVNGPVLRAHLLQVGPDSHYLLLNAHHAAIDGWSHVVLLRELEALYNGFLDGCEASLPSLPIQFGDYGRWEREAIESGAFAPQLDYWRARLRGVPTLDLPTDKPRPAVKSQRGAVLPFALPSALSERIEGLAREAGVSLHMALLAAFQTLLHRYTGQDDIAVGSPSAGRTRVETENLVGFFVNTLVLRGDLSGNPTFRELLARTRRTCLEAYENQDVPFERVVREVQPERDPSRSPLFQAMFALQNTEAQDLRLKGVAAEVVPLKPQATMFDLTLDMEATPAGLRGTIEYSTDLFEAPTIERFLSHFETLLQGIVAAPDARIAELDVLTDAERATLSAWNDTETAYPQDRCIHELVAAQAERAPDKLAIVMGERRVTFRELDEGAGRIAQALRAFGVGRGALVAVCAERSPETLLAQLAILKAGGAYVPMDPAYPADRLAFILQDTGALVLLTHAHLAKELRVPPAVRVVLLDQVGLHEAGPTPDPLLRVASPDDAAYVIYTSGSTGTPKGVVVGHRSLLNLVAWHNRTYAVTPEDRASHVAGLAFDAAVWETWPYLAAGATLHLPPDEVRADPDALQAWLMEKGITLAFVPTPIAERLLGLRWPAETRLRALLTGGDRLTRTPPPGLPFALVNHYGPTEATVVATASRVPATPRADGRAPTIGRPIANTRVHVLDAHRNPVPMGVPGELHIGGKGLAIGYLNRPDLTAERFVPDPFSGEPGARMYRTGDLVRWLPTGELEFLGRTDHQVKIRGFRIELGEIEAALQRHPEVGEAIVLAREDVPGDKRLVAYLVAKGEQPLAAAELREFVKAWLAPYMVPAHYVVLDAFPLTPNGKVDRRALPAPSASASEPDESHVAPRTPLEETLAAVWRDVLRVPRVGVHDNFFELGGDSILSIQVVARAKEKGVRLTSRQVFQHQTVAALAAVASDARGTADDQGPVVGEVPLTPIQRWFFEQDLPARHHFNQSFLLQAPADLDATLLDSAVRHLCAHHDALRFRYASAAKGLVQEARGLADPGYVFHRIDLSAMGSPDAQRAALEGECERLQASLSLAEGPLTRVALFDLGPARGTRVLVVIHHLAVDGVSWRILLEDLETAYAQLQRGEPVRLPAKTTSFKRWAEGLVAHAASGRLDAELPFWWRQTRAEGHGVPVDFVGGANTHASTRTAVVTLSPDETQALLQEVPRAFGTRINDALLTALARAFHAWTGEPDLLLHLEGHGREELIDGVDLSRTVGWFTSMFPLRLHLGDAAADPLAALRRVKEQVHAVPNRGIGYGLLRYLGDAAPSLSRLPAPQVSFNYLGQYDAAATPGGLFLPAPESRGREWAPAGTRANLIDITGAVTEGRLSFEFAYSENLHAAATLERLAASFQAALSDLVARSRAGQRGGYTPADFPLANLDQERLDAVLAGREGNVEDLYPLSPMQQGMLFHALLEPGAAMYLEQAHLVLEGLLDVAAFRRAWQETVARHSILRTAFVWKGLATPLQAVHHRVELPFTHADWRGLGEPEQATELARFLREDRERGLDLESPPLLRVHVVTTRNDVHHVLWTFHHTLLDGWSIPLVVKDVLTLYRAARSGRPAPLPSPPPYREHIAWLTRQDAAEAEAYWRKALAGFHAPTPLVVDEPTPRVASKEHPGAVLVELPPEALDRIQTFARKHRLTLNTLVQGAWGLLLSRYSGERDVLFGATVAGRPDALEGVEQMVGLFINSVPVRVDADPDARVLPWLASLQERQVERRRYEHASLVDVQGSSEVPRGAPLFHSLLVFENYPLDGLQERDPDGLLLRDLDVTERTNYPLTLVALPGTALRLHLHYERARFREETVTRMLGHLRTLLAGLASSPEARLADLPLLTEAERVALIDAPNRTAMEFPRGRTISGCFEEHARRAPEAVALVQAERVLTYRELDERANRLARHLQRLGVGPERRVGLSVERSPEMIVGILGILKAGGAYVPLDPTYPEERLRYMLEDAGIDLLLTQERLLQRIPIASSSVLCLDRDWAERIAPEPASPVVAAAGPRSLAYVIYTSGSTGRPKGVLVEHEGTCSLAAAQAHLFGVGPGSRVLQFASMSFDASVWEVVMALLNGATLVLPDPGAMLTGLDLARQLRERRITVATLPPAALRTLPFEPLPDLRTLITAGEACPPDLVARWSEGRAFYNAYGPTETTVCATVGRCVGPFEVAPPIGRPIPNMRVYLLDAHGHPVPEGVPGEIYVGGVGVARGYLNRPDLTAERFVPDPFVPDPAARLYRTGDLARWLPDGTIEFLGRTDHQVKIRGVRIEPGEIEAALLAHPAVKEAFVMAREDTPGDKRLVAYVVLRDPQALAPGEVRDFLKRSLPDHMVPSHVVPIEAFPLTSNGKVDRRALPAPGGEGAGGRDTYVAPTSPTEDAVARIWAEVLGVERVGIRDDFFALGGHSLLATQVVSRLRETFRVEVPLKAVFDAPTVEALTPIVVEHLLAIIENLPEEEAARLLANLQGDAGE